MQIIHFTSADDPTIRFGCLLEDGVVDGTDLIEFDSSKVCGGINDRFDLDGTAIQSLRERCDTSAKIDRDSVQLLAPVPRPGKVFCIGLNYHDHAQESGMDLPSIPLVFSKFSGCVIGPGDAISLPPGAKEVDYEAELAVVIGRHASGVQEADAMDYVLGYCCANDVSARDFQFTDGQWQRGKSCGTFCPLGPYLATCDEISDPHKLSIHMHLNGEEMQASNTEQLIFGVPRLVEFLSGFIPLEPGDVILTGTPPGVGFARSPEVYLKAGDSTEVQIEGLGTLANSVIQS